MVIATIFEQINWLIVQIGFNAFECGANHIAADALVIVIVVIAVGVVVVDVGTDTVVVVGVVMIARTGVIIIFDLNALRFIATILKPNFYLRGCEVQRLSQYFTFGR